MVTLDDDGVVGLGEYDAIERCLDHVTGCSTGTGKDEMGVEEALDRRRPGSLVKGRDYITFGRTSVIDQVPLPDGVHGAA